MDDCDTQQECINQDLDWVKDALRPLTTPQRRLILKEYAELVANYGIGITEYKAFIKAFDELEE